MGFDSSLERECRAEELIREDELDQLELVPNDGPSDAELNAQAVAASVAMDVQEMVMASKYARVGTGRTSSEQQLTLGNSAELRDALLGQPDLLAMPTWTSLSDVMALRGANSLLHGGVRTAEWLAQLLATRGFKTRWTLIRPEKLFWLAWRVHAEMRLVHDLTQIGVQLGGHCVVAGSYALHRLMLLELGVEPGFAPGDLDVFLSVPQASRDRAFERVHTRLADFFCAGPGVRHPVKSDYGKKEKDDYLGQRCDVTNLQTPITRERVVELINSLSDTDSQKRRWGAAVHAQLPERFSLGRLYRLGRVTELGYGIGTKLNGWEYKHRWTTNVYSHAYPRPELVSTWINTQHAAAGWANMWADSQTCPAIGLLGWTLPLRANIIEIVSTTPCDAMGVVAAFDMEQCKVALSSSAAGVEFVCSDVTRHCAAHRLIRFCPMLLPACQELRRAGDDGELVPWFTRESLHKMVARVSKYESRGFRVEFELLIRAITQRRSFDLGYGMGERHEFEVEWHVVGPDGAEAEGTGRYTSWETEAEVRRFHTGRMLLLGLGMPRHQQR